MIGLIRSTAVCISRCGKHGDQAAMRAEPFHQQWFVLITHEKHKALKMFRSNTIICVSLLETATENSKHPIVLANEIATIKNGFERA